MVSKTFGTQETLLNGAIVREWLGTDTHLLAVTSNIERAAQFGIPAERILPMWDWVGGRYSLWSAVGLPIAPGARDARVSGPCSPVRPRWTRMRCRRRCARTSRRGMP
jgi:glucose-6-phosphate isomerase